MKIDKVDLATFRFRGGLRSAFLGSSEFAWSVHRPSSEKPGVWREVDKATALKDGGLPLFMAAVVQPWTNLRLKLDVGVISSSDTCPKDCNGPQDIYGNGSGALFLIFKIRFLRVRKMFVFQELVYSIRINNCPATKNSYPAA